MNNLLKKLDEHFVKTPDKIAFTDTKDGVRMTYAELDVFSGKVYSYLKRHAISKNDIVLINVPRSVYSLAILIGIWKAGACSILFEEGYPEKYLEHIVLDCQPKMVIDSSIMEELESETYLSGREKVDPNQYAFVSYTSGSTGNPKGIRHFYKTIDTIIENLSESVKNAESFLFPSSLYFIGLEMFFCPIIYLGKEFIIADEASRKNINALVDIIKKYKVAGAFFLPSQLRRFPVLAENLKVVLVGGERTENLYIPGINLYNVYCQTETGLPIVFMIDKLYDNAPIGNINQNPILHIEFFDEAKTEGELYIKIGYDNEYINLPEKSAEVFFEGMYRTGDIASVDENGYVYIKGRNDDMFKINGNRCEANAISEICRRVLHLDAAFTFFRDVEGRKAIVLYFISKNGIEVGPSDYDVLSNNMPSYMIPYYYVKLDEFPRLPNGKIDRLSLPLPKIKEKKTDDGKVSPLEREICNAMEEALRIKRVGVDEDFFEIGGDSLSCMEVIVKLDKYPLSMMTLIKGRTPRNIAADILSADPKEVEEIDKEYRKKGITLNAFQSDMLDYQLQTPSCAMINIPVVLRFKKDEVDEARLIDSIYQLITVHPVFKTKLSFEEENERFIQRYYDDASYTVETIDINEEEFQRILPTLDKPFKVFDELLYVFRIYKTEDYLYLFSDFSHLISDGTSLGVIFGNLEKIYLGKPVAKDYYYYNMLYKEQKVESQEYINDKKYYDDLFGNKEYIHTLIPTSMSNMNGKIAIDCDVSDKWDEMNAYIERSGISENVLILALSLIALYKYENSENVMISWVYNGRKTQQIINSVGEYITSLPIGVSITNTYTFEDLYNDIKTQLMGGIEHDAYSYVFNNHRISLNDFIRVIDEGELLSFGGNKDFPYEVVDVQFEKQAIDTFAVTKIIGGQFKKLVLEYMDYHFKKSDMNEFISLMRRIFDKMIASRPTDIIAETIH